MGKYPTPEKQGNEAAQLRKVRDGLQDALYAHAIGRGVSDVSARRLVAKVRAIAARVASGKLTKAAGVQLSRRFALETVRAERAA